MSPTYLVKIWPSSPVRAPIRLAREPELGALVRHRVEPSGSVRLRFVGREPGTEDSVRTD
jgi:hypothetical protein